MNAEKPKVFISYSWKDAEISRKIADNLRRDGAEVWIDTSRISVGDSLPDAIGEGIEWCNIFLLVWSKSAKESYYVKLERNSAVDNRKRIIPCIIDIEKVPTILTAFYRIDFNNFEQGYRNLTKTLRLGIQEKESKITAPKIPEVKKHKAIEKIKETVENITGEKVAIELIREAISVENILSPKAVKQEPSIKKLIYKTATMLLAVIGLASIYLSVDYILPGISENETKKLLEKNGLFDRYKNQNGKGFGNEYVLQKINGDRIILDQTTNLIWQRSGSPNYMSYGDTKKYVDKLNNDRFAGSDKWRLPTLEEAMSLMKPKFENDLLINPVFDSKQRWIWTVDQVQSKLSQWYVDFNIGASDWIPFGFNLYVRAVRSAKSSNE